jgi:predicted cobalt transporter CbtA
VFLNPPPLPSPLPVFLSPAQGTSLSLSLVTIAVAWISYRPLLAVGLLAVALTPLVLNGHFNPKAGGASSSALAPAPATAVPAAGGWAPSSSYAKAD